MKLFNKLLISVVAILLFVELLGGYGLAQDEGSEKYSGEVCWFGSALCLVPVMLFVVSLAIAIWMYRDAERRGKNGELWLIIELLLPIIGLIIWLVVRPPTLSS